MESVRSALIPMAGRMLHDEEGRLRLIPYGNKPHEVIYSVSRAGLNTLLLDAAEATGRVAIRFGVYGQRRRFRGPSGALPRRRESRTPGLTLRGPHRDGWERLGGSRRDPGTDRRTARRGAARPRVQGALDSCRARRPFRLEKNALHIWPRGEYMLIALPNVDGSFTATLFLPNQGEESFEALTTTEAVHTLFERRFADAIALMPRLGEDFFAKSHRPSRDDPVRALVVRGSCARPGRCGARDRALSRAGHERGVRRLQRLRPESPQIRIARGTRSSRNSKKAAGPIPTRSPTWPWKTTSRCGRPSGSRSFS